MDLAYVNLISGQVVDAAMRVHTHLGPGLLESAYEAFLAHALRERGYDVRTQVPVPVEYKRCKIDVCYRIDMLVADAVVVELKTVLKVHSVHEAQLLSNIRLANFRVGLLINFWSRRLKDGITRMVNDRWSTPCA